MYRAPTGFRGDRRGFRNLAGWLALVGALALVALPSIAGAEATPEPPGGDRADEGLGADEQALRDLVGRSRLQRIAWTEAARRIREAMALDGGLVRGHVQVELRAVKREYLDLRAPLYRLAYKHVPALSDHTRPPALRLRAIGISLLAGLTLYENARLLQRELLAIPGVRAALNQADPALRIPPNLWDEIESNLYRLDHHALLEEGLRVLEAGSPSRGGAAPDALLRYVSAEVADGRAGSEIVADRRYRQIGRVLRHHARRLGQLVLDVPGQTRTQLSRVFGNTVGLVELRQGKLTADEGWRELVRARLQPGDLLLEKTPFRLTDALIPGHFGHVAMYAGTESELRGLGLADHPAVAPVLERVAAGRTIIEALRDGTQINTLERFLNVDDLVILRPKSEHVPAADVRWAIALAFSHLGKRYDFAFDANTWDTLVCSELAFHSYVNVRWPTARVLAAYTITPDDVARLAGSDPSRPFELVLFVHDGRLVHDPATALDGEAL
jgi:uncharacterized protein YycO